MSQWFVQRSESVSIVSRRKTSHRPNISLITVISWPNNMFMYVIVYSGKYSLDCTPY